jgi:hypothetical protein
MSWKKLVDGRRISVVIFPLLSSLADGPAPSDTREDEEELPFDTVSESDRRPRLQTVDARATSLFLVFCFKPTPSGEQIRES